MEGTNNFNGGSTGGNFNSKYKSIDIGEVVSIDDDEGFDRIKVAINGPTASGGDNGINIEDLSWCTSMVPKFFSSKPKVGESVYVFTLADNKKYSDRLYIGPIISQNQNLSFDSKSTTGLGSFNFATIKPDVDIKRIPELRGVFSNDEDISIQGRYNTDLIFKKNEILIRSGKFTPTQPTEKNPYPFIFNNKTQGYIQIKNDVVLKKSDNNVENELGTVTNIVASKINLLTHKDGAPRFNLTNQENLIDDTELANILSTAHPLPFGDILVQYLKLLKSAFLAHVHNGDGRPPTDITAGNSLPVSTFLKNADTLEKQMLSENIRIN